MKNYFILLIVLIFTTINALGQNDKQFNFEIDGKINPATARILSRGNPANALLQQVHKGKNKREKYVKNEIYAHAEEGNKRDKDNNG